MAMRVLLGLVVLASVVRAQGGDANADDLKKLQGTWKLVAANGKDVGKDMVGQLVISGDKIEFTGFGEPKASKADLKIDAGRKPKHIDFENDKGTDKASVGRGIYHLDGDTLKVCMGPGERPKDFEDKKGLVLTFQRVKK